MAAPGTNAFTMSIVIDQLFATVAVDQPLDAAYTYVVPPEMVKDIRMGSRVTVPLGRSNRLTPATVLSLSKTPPEAAKGREKVEVVEEESLFEPAGGGGGGR